MEVRNDPSITLGALEALRTRREARTRAPASIAAELSSYILAASVLHVFNPSTLQPLGAADATGAYDLLFANSSAAVGWAGLRTLRMDVRRRALRVLGSAEAIRTALQANPARERTTLQKLFDRAVENKLGDLGRLRLGELEELKQLYEWQLPELIDMPALEAFNAAHRRRADVARFEHLVDANFVGRQADLQVLRDHVGVVSPSLWQQLRAFFSSDARRPLFISAPGGGGKTALLGRFLLEHVEAPQNGWFPFAYIAFDADAIDVREPFTLLVEIAAQLAAQVERAASIENVRMLDGAFERYRNSVAGYRDRRNSLSHRASAFTTQKDRIESLTKEEDDLLTEFSQLLERISAEAQVQQIAKLVPVLIVFDTFEEVVYRAGEDLIGFWRMISGLSRRFSPLRIVISGRAGPGARILQQEGITEHVLADLGTSDAALLLERLGVTPRDRATALALQVGGNPLTLRLAARVMVEEAEQNLSIAGLQTRRFGFLKVSPALIRGQLYRRVLDHIHDDDVRALAHPGMVLRRVTPAIVREVLAPLCAIKDAGKRAEDLFNMLRNEHALVRLEGDGSLRYRDEVRRPVLELLVQDRPEEVQAIHQAVVNYYSGYSYNGSGVWRVDLDDPVVARAEEIYHRLMLEQESWELDERWMRGVESYLATAIEEIPFTQRIWLAQRMSIELPSEVYAMADAAAWERLIGPKVLEMVRYGEFQGAAEIIGSRTDRTPDSPLYALEARVLIALGRPEDAATLIDRALADYPAMGNPLRSAELLWLYAQALAQSGGTAAMISALRSLADLSEPLPTSLPLVQALTELIGRLEAEPILTGVSAIKERLALALARLTLSEVRQERSMVRLALVRLGPDFPRTAERLLGEVYDQWAYMAGSGLIDIHMLIGPALEVLGQSTNSRVVEIAAESRKQGPDGKRLVDEFGALLAEVQAGAQLLDHAALEAIYLLLGAEQSTLASATLAGIDEARSDWEGGGSSPEALT